MKGPNKAFDRAVLSFPTILVLFLPFSLQAGGIQRYDEVLDPPVFSRIGGFYSEPLFLRLSAPPGVTIYYTLDGSEPDPKNLGGATYRYKNRYPQHPGDSFGPFLERTVTTFEYEQTIPISDRSRLPDEVATINSLFTRDTMPPVSRLFKGTPVRARAFREGVAPSATETHTYFIHPEHRYDLLVLAVTADERHFFDYEAGIYVPGKIADDWREANPQAHVDGVSPANYHGRGRDWERPAHLEIFGTGGERVFAQGVGLRIHGGWSRWFAPNKSLRVYSRHAYDRRNEIEFPFFPGRTAGGIEGKPLESFRRLILRNSGNDHAGTLYRDALLQELVRHLPIDSQGYRPAIHFVNGEYWGIINVRERFDQHYLASHYGVDPDEVVILTGNAELDTGIESDRQHYLDLLDFAANQDLSDDAAFAHIARLMDVDNFAAYCALQIYIGNDDWPQNNIDFWRKRTDGYKPGAPRGHDGRWRWMLYDLDFGFDGSVAWRNSLARVAENRNVGGFPPYPWANRLFQDLLGNPGFRSLFINTLADLKNTAFHPERVHPLVDEFNARIESSRNEHFNRWRGGTDRGGFLKDFAVQRPGHLRNHVVEVFELPGTVDVSVAVNSATGGAVRLNSIIPDPAAPGMHSDRYDRMPLFSDGAAGWRYLDDGSDQGTAWRSAEFFDLDWRVGRGGFGYGEPADFATGIRYGDDPDAKPITTYFRRAFQWDHPDLPGSLSVAVNVAGGAVVYLNGTEVLRHRMPDGPIDYTTPAATVFPEWNGLIFRWAADGRLITRSTGGEIFVSVWEDLSGNGRHASQPVQSRQPRFIRNAVNEKPVVRFDGTEDFLQAPVGDYRSGMTLFLVARVNADAQPFGSYAGLNGAGDGNVLYHVGSEGGRGLAIGQPNLDLSGNPAAAPGFELIRIEADPGFTHRMTRSASQESVSAEIIRTDGVIDHLTLAASRNASGEITGFLPVDIAEVVLYDRMLTEPEILDVEMFLAGKYAIELPSPVTYELSAENLVGGTNVLAAEVHQPSPSAKRFYFDLALCGNGVALPTWTGTYFQGVPVEVEAIPEAGYRFAGWLGREETDAVLTLALSDAESLMAVFLEDANGIPASGMLALLEGEGPSVFDAAELFESGGDPTFSAESSRPFLVKAEVSGADLTLEPLRRGEAEITVVAADGENPPESRVFRVLVYPAAHALSDGAFRFAAWNPETPELTYPGNMLFLQSGQDDPGPAVPLEHTYHIEHEDYHANDSGTIGFPYNNTGRTRINGLGEDGISFINSGRGRDLGGALVALDTRGVSEVNLSWLAGTVAPNSREYALRLQYRAGVEGEFADVLDDDGRPLEYVRNMEAGHVEAFGPVALPEDALDRENLQLLWRYYHLSGDSGSRAELRLDDIAMSAGPVQAGGLLVFDAAPAGAAQAGRPLSPVVVRVVNEDGLTDGTFDGEVTLDLQGDGELEGPAVVHAVEGVAVFEGLRVDGFGRFQLRASAGGMDPVESPSFAVVLVTELVAPRFIQGDQDVSGENLDRVPFAYRLRFDGLEPNATYRYGNRVVTGEDPPDQNGAGNMIFATGSGDWIRNTNAPRFLSSDFGDRHYEFTTDASGSHTGWFVTEPTGNPRFTPGNTVFMRVLLNDGAGGEDLFHYLTAPAEVTVIPFGEGANEGTGIIGESDAGPRNFVLLYADEAGEERPLAATPVEITGSWLDARYVGFYETIVGTNDQMWGTLIPNDLPGGVRRIEERAFADGGLLSARQAPAGFDGTVNPSSGDSPILLDFGEEEAVFLPGGTAAWTNADNWTADFYPNGVDARAVINEPIGGNRDITLEAPVTVGTITFNNAGTSFRNRIAGAEHRLTFDRSSGPARLTVHGDGDGFVEFDVEGGTILESDLIVTVNNLAGDPEFGALRLRQGWMGPGGLAKSGPGVLSLTGGGKNFMGPIIINEGVIRVTESSVPGLTSGVSVNPGGQLRLVSLGGPEEPRVYHFGRELTLNSEGRGGDVPVGEEEGILGALRMDPGQNDNYAIVTNDVVMAGPSGLHVDGTRNTMELIGTFSGTSGWKKSGGGTLVLSGENSAFTHAISLETGVLRVDGPLGSDIFLDADTVLEGAGSVGNLTGLGTIAPATTVLTADSVDGLHYAFDFSRTGSPHYGDPAASGNSVLRLQGQVPFVNLFNAVNVIDIFLNRDGLFENDAFRGGFFVGSEIDLEAAVSGATLRYHVLDDEGDFEHGGRSYRRVAGGDGFTLGVVSETATFGDGPVHGKVIEVRRAPASLTYSSWADVAFPDPAERDDPAFSGPFADPAGEGIFNLLRYALEIDFGSARELPAVAIEDGRLTLRFRRDERKSDIAYIVEAASTPADWQEILYDSSASAAPNNDGEFMRIVDSKTVAEAGPSRFLRLRVVLEESP